MTLYVFCGLPGSGKTTASSGMAIEKKLKCYHYDDFKKNYIGQGSRQIHRYLYEFIMKDLLMGYDVILDDLHTKLQWRIELLEALQDISCEKKIIVMTTPFEECVRRSIQRKNNVNLPRSIIYCLNNEYEPPSLEEGWDEILYY